MVSEPEVQSTFGGTCFFRVLSHGHPGLSARVAALVGAGAGLAMCGLEPVRGTLCGRGVPKDREYRGLPGRWVAVGGGGYETTDVVPRTWTHLLAEAAGHPISPVAVIPQEWLALARQTTGRAEVIGVMTDGHDPDPRAWESGYDPADAVDGAVMLTRRAVFPWHGLFPEP
ncbi:hypothetical protein ABH920_004393 [Catenulispora sp. EB89]|uniref:hypothetical protein n=1 Tax=Catenulispora sp. EB89 TaxID=3156257 RepID=UPI0035145FA7